METFEIEIQRHKKPQIMQVIQKRPIPNKDGYLLFEVKTELESSIVYIDQECLRSPIIYTEHDAWNYLETMLYPEPGQIYSEDDVYLPDELELIRTAIGKHFIQS